MTIICDRNAVSPSAWLLMHVDAKGHVGFQQEDGSWGGLAGAVGFSEKADNLPAECSWVRADEAWIALLAVVRDRRGLARVIDFEKIHRDRSGQPIVWRASMFCRQCHHEWLEMAAERVVHRYCPMCRAAVRAAPGGATWVGPASEQLKTLWEHLPPTLRPLSDLPSSLRVSALETGVLVEDDLSNKIVVRQQNDQLQVIVCHHRNAMPLIVTLDAESAMVISGKQATNE